MRRIPDLAELNVLRGAAIVTGRALQLLGWAYALRGRARRIDLGTTIHFGRHMPVQFAAWITRAGRRLAQTMG